MGITSIALRDTVWVINGVTYRFSDCAIKRIRAANRAVDVNGLGLPSLDFWNAANHFDGERFWEASHRLMFLRNSIVAKLVAVPPDPLGAHRDLGAALHTLQDFYSHTNWVEMGNELIKPELGVSPLVDPVEGFSPCPIYPDTLAGQGLSMLTSGYFPTNPCNAPPSGKCLHGWDGVWGLGSCGGINKDEPNRPYFQQAYWLAIRASRDYVKQIFNDIASNARELQAIDALTRGDCPSIRAYEFNPSRSWAPGVKGAAAFEHANRGSNMGATLGRRQASVSQWLLYPGACTDLYESTWSPRTYPIADSLNTYTPGSTGPYTRTDHTELVGELWQIVAGNFASTPDACQTRKNDDTDLMFFGVDPGTKKTIPGQFNSVVSCAFPVPSGTGSILASWSEYLDLPEGSGYVQFAEYRFARNGSWHDWRNISPFDGVVVGKLKAWVTSGGELAEAAQADSVQLRFNLKCIPDLATDGENCGQVDYGVLYDDLRLEAIAGTPSPLVGVHHGSLAQTTFVDGTMTGLHCQTPPCWPGIRGTDLQNDPDPATAACAITDNFNSPEGDSITVVIRSALRPNGLGVNWRHGYDKSINAGLTIAHTNASFNLAHDVPRMVFSLFDPSSKTWSPLDSTELDADAVEIAGEDTVLVGGTFRTDWPPRDKLELNLSLPGGFTIDGKALYSELRFLPRGTRMRYYFKGVDINGGTSLAMETTVDEIESISPGSPLIPFPSWLRKWLLSFEVLPGVYPSGSPGTLLGGRTNTPILNLDGAYSSWGDGFDPVSQALVAMGARADRYRLLQGLGEGNNIGGHEANQTQGRLSNHLPNRFEYGILDSLASWYRIIVQSSHGRTSTLEDEQDAELLRMWWETPTGTNGGDRCLFVSGDNYFSALLSVPAGDVSQERISYGQNALGVNSAADTWNGTASVPYPTVEDRFANPASGPGLVTGYLIPVDGGCPGPNRFDTLTKMGGTASQSVAFYPLFAGVADVAGVATMTEKDVIGDSDRNKALGYGFSIQYVRKAGIPVTAPNYARSGIEERMRILYKFLASCRGPRSGVPPDVEICWPCPTDPSMTGNWALLPGFQTGTFGPLYAIQDHLTATAVPELRLEAIPFVNALSQNRPNPFNPRTVISYSLAREGRVLIRIFDIAGRLVRTLVDAHQGAGWHSEPWDGRTDQGTVVASGTYFYRIAYPDRTTSAKKMIILR